MEICKKESVSALSGHVPMEVLTCVHMYVCYARQEAMETEKGPREHRAGRNCVRQSSQRNRTNKVLCMCLFYWYVFLSIKREILRNWLMWCGCSEVWNMQGGLRGWRPREGLLLQKPFSSGRLQSIGSQRVRHDQSRHACMYIMDYDYLLYSKSTDLKVILTWKVSSQQRLDWIWPNTWVPWLSQSGHIVGCTGACRCACVCV